MIEDKQIGFDCLGGLETIAHHGEHIFAPHGRAHERPALRLREYNLNVPEPLLDETRAAPESLRPYASALERLALDADRLYVGGEAGVAERLNDR